MTPSPDPPAARRATRAPRGHQLALEPLPMRAPAPALRRWRRRPCRLMVMVVGVEEPEPPPPPPPPEVPPNTGPVEHAWSRRCRRRRRSRSGRWTARRGPPPRPVGPMLPPPPPPTHAGGTGGMRPGHCVCAGDAVAAVVDGDAGLLRPCHVHRAAAAGDAGADLAPAGRPLPAHAGRPRTGAPGAPPARLRRRSRRGRGSLIEDARAAARTPHATGRGEEQQRSGRSWSTQTVVERTRARARRALDREAELPGVAGDELARRRERRRLVGPRR